MINKQNSLKCFLWLAVFLASMEKLNGRYWPKRDAEENDDHLLNILRDHEIIPDLIDDAPHADVLEVNYGNDLLVNRGDEMTPTEVRDQPVNVKWSSDPSQFYTLIFVGKWEIGMEIIVKMLKMCVLKIRTRQAETLQEPVHGNIGLLETFLAERLKGERPSLNVNSFSIVFFCTEN